MSRPLPGEEVRRVLDQLDDVRPNGNGWMARCPAHEDQNPSLSVAEGENGKVLLKCFAGCTFDEIRRALGGLPRSPAPATKSRRTGSPCTRKPPRSYPTADEATAAVIELVGRGGTQHVKSYDYHDVAGQLQLRVLRFQSPGLGQKTFRQISRVDSSWAACAPRPSPLYRVPQFVDASVVWVAEGEKAADAAASIGLPATTSAGGSSAATRTDWTPLAGRDVRILADNDEPGRAYAAEVAGILLDLDPTADVRIVSLPGLQEAEDVVEFIERRRADGADDDAVRHEVESIAAASEPEESGLPIDSGFPLDALPDVLRTFVVETANSMRCDPALIAVPVLAALAGVIGNACRIRLKNGWTEPAVLWLLLIAGSGGGKTPAIKAALAPLREIERELHLEYDERHRKYLAELEAWKVRDVRNRRLQRKGDEPLPINPKPEEPLPVRITADDLTLEALIDLLDQNWRGLLVTRDELAAWVGSFDRYARGNGESARWLEFHTAGTVRLDRKSGEKRSIHVPFAAVSLLGGIQPGILTQTFTDRFVQNGMLARFLAAQPVRRPKRWTEDEVSTAAKQDYSDLLRRLRRLEPFWNGDTPTPRIVPLSVCAQALWQSFYDDFGREQWTASEAEQPTLAKLEAYTARFALILHLAQLASAGDVEHVEPVSESALAASIKLVRWFREQARQVMRSCLRARTRPSEILREKLCAGLLQEPFTERELHRKNWGGLTTTKQRREALEELCTRGELIKEDHRPERGRPSTRYRRPEAHGDGAHGADPVRDDVPSPVTDGTDGTDTTDESDGSPEPDATTGERDANPADRTADPGSTLTPRSEEGTSDA